MTAHHFLLTRLDTGALVGHALLCPEARYVGLRTVNRDAHVSHRAALTADWRAIVEDLRIGWEHGVVDGDSATARAIIPPAERGAVTAQKMTEVVGVEPGAGAAAAFDRYLLTQRFV